MPTRDIQNGRPYPPISSGIAKAPGRLAILLLSAAGLLAQPPGPFRPGGNVPAGLPPTVPSKGPAWVYPAVAFIDSAGYIDGLVGINGTDCIHIDGTSGPCAGASSVPVFSWAEVPSGTLNGVNAVFTLLSIPNPAASLELFRNGILQKASGVDYTLSGLTVTFVAGAIPQAGDLLLATYQSGYAGGTPATCAANTVVAGPTSGAPALPTCRALVAGDIPGGGGGGVWGSITGTLSSQTDLNTALNAKEATANKDAASGYAGLTAGGLLKIAEAPTWNQNTTGTASNVTGVVAEANGGSGANNTPGAAGHVLRSNGAHYVDSAIQAGDVPTLNQSTTGNAATATNLAGGSVGQIPYQSAPSTTALLAGNTAATDQVLVSHGTGAAAQAPTLANAPALSAANMTSFPTLNQSTSGNAATATALASTPTLCGTGNAPTGVLANGNATGCAALGGTSFTYTSVTFSATPTFTFGGGTNTFKLTLTGNVTSSTVASSSAGQPATWVICQDGTGGRTFAWPANFFGAMTIGSTLSKCNTQAFTTDGANFYASSAGVINQ